MKDRDSRFYAVRAGTNMTGNRIEYDLRHAQRLIRDNGLGLVALKDGKVLIEAKERGIRPFVKAVMELGEKLEGAVIGDRVIGRASAMLCIYSGVAAAYTPLASDAAIEELRMADILLVADERTPHILNRNGTDVCPFEKMTEPLESSHEVFRVLVEFFGNEH
ncbi:MAG: DUF1893 domain-containing protein [Bacillota bacterium]